MEKTIKDTTDPMYMVSRERNSVKTTEQIQRGVREKLDTVGSTMSDNVDSLLTTLKMYV